MCCGPQLGILCVYNMNSLYSISPYWVSCMKPAVRTKANELEVAVAVADEVNLEDALANHMSHHPPKAPPST
jgi:hypothetical protein